MCSKPATQPPTPNYSFRSEFTFSGTTCTKTYPAQPNYSCPANYTLSGTTCSMTLSQPATVTMVCPPGTTEQDGTCYGESTTQSECAELEANPKCSHVRDTCLEEERTEEHTSELTSLMRNSYAVFSLTQTTMSKHATIHNYAQ